jgi:hypothetical protein
MKHSFVLALVIVRYIGFAEAQPRAKIRFRRTCWHGWIG